MNDKVEEIYEQMFAPEPIPDCVKTAFETVNRLASRIDAGMMRPVDLAMIAALGLGESTPATVTLSSVPPQHEGLIDTVETSEDSPIPEATQVAAGQTSAVGASDQALPSHGPTGPMDAPRGPAKKGTSKYAMQRMSITELRAHAREFYGYHPKLSMGKMKLIKFLSEREPL